MFQKFLRLRWQGWKGAVCTQGFVTSRTIACCQCRTPPFNTRYRSCLPPSNSGLRFFFNGLILPLAPPACFETRRKLSETRYERLGHNKIDKHNGLHRCCQSPVCRSVLFRPVGLFQDFVHAGQLNDNHLLPAHARTILKFNKSREDNILRLLVLDQEKKSSPCQPNDDNKMFLEKGDRSSCHPFQRNTKNSWRKRHNGARSFSSGTISLFSYEERQRYDCSKSKHPSNSQFFSLPRETQNDEKTQGTTTTTMRAPRSTFRSTIHAEPKTSLRDLDAATIRHSPHLTPAVLSSLVPELEQNVETVTARDVKLVVAPLLWRCSKLTSGPHDNHVGALLCERILLDCLRRLPPRYQVSKIQHQQQQPPFTDSTSDSRSRLVTMMEGDEDDEATLPYPTKDMYISTMISWGSLRKLESAYRTDRIFRLLLTEYVQEFLWKLQRLQRFPIDTMTLETESFLLDANQLKRQLNILSPEPCRKVYKSLLRAWAVSDAPQASERASQLLDEMEYLSGVHIPILDEKESSRVSSSSSSSSYKMLPAAIAACMAKMTAPQYLSSRHDDKKKQSKNYYAYQASVQATIQLVTKVLQMERPDRNCYNTVLHSWSNSCDPNRHPVHMHEMQRRREQNNLQRPRKADAVTRAEQVCAVGQSSNTSVVVHDSSQRDEQTKQKVSQQEGSYQRIFAKDEPSTLLFSEFCLERVKAVMKRMTLLADLTDHKDEAYQLDSFSYHSLFRAYDQVLQDKLTRVQRQEKLCATKSNEIALLIEDVLSVAEGMADALDGFQELESNMSFGFGIPLVYGVVVRALLLSSSLYGSEDALVHAHDLVVAMATNHVDRVRIETDRNRQIYVLRIPRNQETWPLIESIMDVAVRWNQSYQPAKEERVRQLLELAVDSPRDLKMLLGSMAKVKDCAIPGYPKVIESMLFRAMDSRAPAKLWPNEKAFSIAIQAWAGSDMDEGAYRAELVLRRIVQRYQTLGSKSGISVKPTENQIRTVIWAWLRQCQKGELFRGVEGDLYPAEHIDRLLSSLRGITGLAVTPDHISLALQARTQQKFQKGES